MIVLLFFFLFEIKLKVNYIDLNFKFVLIIEDVEDVKFGYVMWCNIMGICVLKYVCYDCNICIIVIKVIIWFDLLWGIYLNVINI